MATVLTEIEGDARSRDRTGYTRLDRMYHKIVVAYINDRITKRVFFMPFFKCLCINIGPIPLFLIKLTLTINQSLVFIL